MALIKCTHCGKEINNKRDKCLLCGKAIPEELRFKEENVVNKESLLKETSLPLKMKSKTGNLFKTFIVLVVSFLLSNVLAVDEAVPFAIIFGMPILISIIYYRYSKKQAEEQAEEQAETLSEKYDILVSYKGLAFLLMLVATGAFLFSLVQFIDTPGSFGRVMIVSAVSYVITMFSLFCLTKIIDFLYDLDKK